MGRGAGWLGKPQGYPCQSLDAPSGKKTKTKAHNAGSISNDSDRSIHSIDSDALDSSNIELVQTSKKKGKGRLDAPKQKKLCKAARDDADSGDDAPYKNKMVLFIPHASGDGNQHVNLPLTTTYDSALEVIYETIGCDKVNQKLGLSYKLMSATAKTPATSLGSEDNWEGLQDDIKAAQCKQKETVAANIIAAEQYMKSLRAMSSMKKWGKKASGSRKQGKKTSVALMDLNPMDSDEDDSDSDISFMEHEKEELQKLKTAHSACVKCGSSQRAWATALAMASPNVTLNTPLKAQLFKELFTSKMVTALSASAPETPLQVSNQLAAMMNPAYPFMPMAYPPHPWMPTPPPQPHFSYPHLPESPYYLQSEPQSSSHRRKDDIPSSDPTDEDLQKPSYPDIAEFLTKLNEKHPRRNLICHIDDFESKDFYTIDEMTKLSNDNLCTQFNFTIRNAQFFLAEVKKNIKHISHAYGKSRSRNN
ncbi:hypothetical protein M413DRAFT_21261 [Hebeloma cylindrosporum]|uniref:Uncharacterized protein n=1 Tax=Hebeloma cylindrosporum TaxID=76867 RepID=A0A0C3CJR5_HEBCY|nr:hypothetical protein M413DRAFT_21261 [Hebeloma cylindrosporum h7]